MSHIKRRTSTHIMESRSKELVKSLLPVEWVIRELSPDYGIDLIIEVFESTAKDQSKYETLGEFLYVQLKSAKQVKVTHEAVASVQNVAKVGNWIEDKSISVVIDVIKFVIDTSTIKTAQATGAGICNLLFLADLSSNQVYFVCLNDLIDKLIIPNSQAIHKQEHLTISIPLKNKINDKVIGLTALRFYAKRAKMLSAFSVFSYQRNELLNFLDIKDAPVQTYRDVIKGSRIGKESEIYSLILHFINQIEAYDFWTKTDMWPPIREEYKNLMSLKDYLLKAQGNQSAEFNYVREQALLIWHRLSNLNNMYQELCREWYLPKYLAHFLSYP